MKRIFSVFLIAFTLTSYVPKANAVGGLMSGQYAFAAIGGVSMLVSLPIFKVANRLGREGHKGQGFIIGLVASTLWLGGMWFLDEENNAFEFLPIKKDSLSPAEAIYNSELDELNAVKDMVAVDLSQNEFKTVSEMHDFVAKKWMEYGQGLSPETLQVRASIVQGLIK